MPYGRHARCFPFNVREETRGNPDTSLLSSRKFGKHLQKRQLDIPEYGASFVNYKALKKVLIDFQTSEIE